MSCGRTSGDFCCWYAKHGKPLTAERREPAWRGLSGPKMKKRSAWKRKNSCKDGKVASSLTFGHYCLLLLVWKSNFNSFCSFASHVWGKFLQLYSLTFSLTFFCIDARSSPLSKPYLYDMQGQHKADLPAVFKPFYYPEHSWWDCFTAHNISSFFKCVHDNKERVTQRATLSLICFYTFIDWDLIDADGTHTSVSGECFRG